jgi:SOS-response transcriptional repressor LexA
MVSRKIAALDFIKRYFAEWGHSPSLAELGAALGVSKPRASELVEQLSVEKQILHTRGKRRGIALIDPAGEMSQADALLRLRALGWAIDNGGKAVAPPSLTNPELSHLPLLDHDPARDTGVGQDDGTSD